MKQPSDGLIDDQHQDLSMKPDWRQTEEEKGKTAALVEKNAFLLNLAAG